MNGEEWQYMESFMYIDTLYIYERKNITNAHDHDTNCEAANSLFVLMFALLSWNHLIENGVRCTNTCVDARFCIQVKTRRQLIQQKKKRKSVKIVFIISYMIQFFHDVAPFYAFNARNRDDTRSIKWIAAYFLSVCVFFFFLNCGKICILWWQQSQTVLKMPLNI